MESRYILLILLITVLFISGANAIRVSMYGGEGGNSGGSSVNLIVPDDETLNLRTILGDSGGISQSIKGSGSINESHFVENANGDRAEISVDVADAEYYDYGYSLYPGEGGDWSGKYVSSGETLTASNASSIIATAAATNSGGNRALVRFETSDASGKASLEGYSNYAEASKGSVKASQLMGPISSHYNLRTNIHEEAGNLNTTTIHEFLSESDSGPFSLSEYSAEASAANGETGVVVDYAQLNFPTYFVIEDTSSYYQDIKKAEENVADVWYYSEQPQQVSAYHSKASSKGKKLTAELAIQMDYTPSDMEIVALIGAPIFYRILELDGPGTYTATAEFDGKKANVNIEKVK
jgi:hypothetical protein